MVKSTRDMNYDRDIFVKRYVDRNMHWDMFEDGINEEEVQT